MSLPPECSKAIVEECDLNEDEDALELKSLSKIPFFSISNLMKKTMKQIVYVLSLFLAYRRETLQM